MLVFGLSPHIVFVYQVKHRNFHKESVPLQLYTPLLAENVPITARRRAQTPSRPEKSTNIWGSLAVAFNRSISDLDFRFKAILFQSLELNNSSLTHPRCELNIISTPKNLSSPS